MDTPIISHLTANDYRCVYEPAEDSFLLIDALEMDLQLLKNSMPKICVEIGSGSGIVITALAMALKTNASYFAIDINPYACCATQKTGQQNKVTNFDVVNMDLLTAWKERTIDVLLFNPPYVVTSDNEISGLKNDCSVVDGDYDASDGVGVMLNSQQQFIQKSWAGGSNDGRCVMDKIFTMLDNLLCDSGVAYVLVIKDNKPHKIIDDLRELGFFSEIIANRKIRGEHLFVLRIKRM